MVFKSLFSLSLGQVVATIINIVTIPLITAYYNPADFGIYSQALAIINILAPVFFLRTEQSLYTRKNLTFLKSDILNIFKLGLLGCCLSLMISATLLHYDVLPISIFDFILFQFILISTACINLVYITFICTNNAPYSSLTKFTASVTTNISKVILGKFYVADLQTLFVSSLVGGSASLCIIARKLLKLKSSEHREGLWHFILARKDFISYNSLSTVVAALANYATPLMLAVYYKPILIGYYALTRMILSLPTVILSAPLGDLIFTKVSQKVAPANIPNCLLNIFCAFVLIFLIPCALVIEYYEWFVAYVLSEDWAESASVAGPMAAQVFISFCVAPIGCTFILLKKQKLHLIMSSIIVLSQLLVINTLNEIPFWDLLLILSVCYFVTILIGYVVPLILNGGSIHSFVIIIFFIAVFIVLKFTMLSGSNILEKLLAYLAMEIFGVFGFLRLKRATNNFYFSK